jgi:hypothetical protein
VASGNFFEGVPAGGDAYMMSHIIHDWPEEQCLTILGHCRRAMPDTGRLLLFEMVIPPGPDFHPGKLLDKAGFRQTRVVPTASAVSVVEAVPS